MMVMSQLTLMVAAWAMLMAQPMMIAQTQTLTRDTVISFPPDACKHAAELTALQQLLTHKVTTTLSQNSVAEKAEA